MKLVLFETPGAPARFGMLDGQGVTPIDTLEGDTPQEKLLQLIEIWHPDIAGTTTPISLTSVRLLPPVPWPGKILVTTARFGTDTPEPQPLLATLKSPESVIGPGDTIHLPDADSSWQFVPQAMLGLVIRGPAKNVLANAWRSAVFGYTCVVDVMARGDQQFGRDFWLAKADTLGPLGPCILTADEVPDPSLLRARSWQNGASAQDFGIADASHSIPEQLQFVTTVMTLHRGDVVACGTSPGGPRPLADGDHVEVEIEPIGRLAVKIAAPVRSAP